ncbi:hypothetical protein DY000_02014758 [Brassica cretica]|uniref:Uncharacterized protein n=1 Tax=Brassica cretica TaxID=69181 RepID=A0ABQ7CZB0_BRACR|nr:hypothetical protein DY000_02014758 [Brassica cretica]
MIERRSFLESCTRSIVCDFRLSLFLNSFDSSGLPFSLGRLLERSCESRTLLSSSSSEEELGRARITWTRRRLREAPLRRIDFVSLSLFPPKISSSQTKFTGNQVLQRDIFVFFASVAVFAQPAKQSSYQTTSPKVSQIGEQKNRAWSFSVLVYLRVEEEKVLKCVLVNHTGSHSKIHHTEEDSGCDECSTGS